MVNEPLPVIAAPVPATRLLKTTSPIDSLLFTEDSPEILAKLIVAVLASEFWISKFSILVIVAAGKFAAVFAAPSTAYFSERVSVPAPPSIESPGLNVSSAAVLASITALKVSFLSPPVKSSLAVVNV